MGLFSFLFKKNHAKPTVDVNHSSEGEMIEFLNELPRPISANQLYSRSDVEQLIRYGLTLDVKNGGLVMGPSHADGGITILKPCLYGYELVGEMEGYEYIWSSRSVYLYSTFTPLLNVMEDMIPPFIPFECPPHVTILDTTLPDNFHYKFYSKWLILDNEDSHFIFNKFSTKARLLVIDAMNTMEHKEVMARLNKISGEV